MTTPQPPLTGLKVLDLTRLLPGPFATRLLADLGADVVKVEEPGGGDYMRYVPPLIKHQSAHFLAVNTNKRSLALDLRNEAGARALRLLLGSYDVLIESFRPGVMERFGLGYEALREQFPRLIFVSLSGYGQTGPYAQRAGHDGNYQAITGGVGVTGTLDGQPVLPGVQAADMAGGLYAAYAIVAAALGRQSSGRGCFVDVALADASLALMSMPFADYFGGGVAPGPAGQAVSGKYVCYNLYRTADGRHMSLCALEPKFWQRFCAAVGRPELAEEGFADARPGQGVYDAVVEIFLQKTLAEWTEFFAEVDCCCEPVLSLDEVADHPQVRARGGVREVEHPTEGRYRQLAQPLHGAPSLLAPYAPAPSVGQHTRDVMLAAGVTADELDALVAAGAFGPPTID